MGVNEPDIGRGELALRMLVRVFDGHLMALDFLQQVVPHREIVRVCPTKIQDVLPEIWILSLHDFNQQVELLLKLQPESPFVARHSKSGVCGLIPSVVGIVLHRLIEHTLYRCGQGFCSLILTELGDRAPPTCEIARIVQIVRWCDVKSNAPVGHPKVVAEQFGDDRHRSRSGGGRIQRRRHGSTRGGTDVL